MCCSMSNLIEFNVDGKVVPMPRPRVVTSEVTGKTRAYNSNKSKAYKRIVKMMAISAMNSKRMRLTHKPLEVSIYCYFSPPKSYTKKKLKQIDTGELRYIKKPDLDNIAKTILDAMNGVVYHDDSQIGRLFVSKDYSDKDFVVVKVNELI